MKSKFVLLIIFIFCAIYFSLSLRSSGFHLLSYDQVGQRQEINFSEGEPLLYGEKVTINTKAEYNNLGNILVRFTNNNRDGDDQLIFKIVEKNTNRLIYSALYNTDQFLPDKLFPFGFEPIQNSAGRDYLVTIESTRGSSVSGTYISANNPIFIFRTILSKEELVKNPKQVLGILTSKVKFIWSSPDILRTLLLSFVPLILYFLFHIYSKSSYAYQILVFIFFSSFIHQLKSAELDYYLLGLVSYWVVLSLRRKFPNLATIILALCYFVLAFGLGITNKGISSDAYFSLSLVLVISSLIFQIINFQKSDEAKIDSFFSGLNNFDREKGINLANTISLFGKTAFYIFLANKLSSSLQQLLSAPKILASNQRQYDKEVLALVAFVVVTTILCKTVLLIFRKFRNDRLSYPLLLLACQTYVSLNSYLFFYLVGHTNIPKIVTISPKSTTEAWVDVTITGKNFQDRPFVGNVTLAGEVQVENVWFWSNEKIIFRTNPATTKTGDICVITMSKGNSNCEPFTYNFGKK